MGQHRSYFPRTSNALLEEDGPNDEEATTVLDRIPRNHVCSNFDEALVFAEDILITCEDPTLLKVEQKLKHDLAFFLCQP